MKRFYLFLLSISLLNSSTVFASVQDDLRALEASTGGRLGISAINSANNQRIQFRADERFPMGCTSKLIGVAAILKKSMSDKNLLEEKILITKNDLTNWNPITKNYISKNMTVSQLCAAAISYSDNAAMNLVANKLGGIQEINKYARSLGDNYFKLDHMWPGEAKANPKTSDDSSTPNAMNENLQKLTLSDALEKSQREKLLYWLKKTVTGTERIRAGVPKNWIVGDKTGTGFYYGTTNDTAIIWPTNCAPIFVTIYYSNNKKDSPNRNDVLASATKTLITEFAKKDLCIKQALSRE